MIFPVKRLADLGFEILATAGHRRGAAPQRRARRPSSASTARGPARTASRPSCGRILDGEVDLVVNTPHGTTGGGSPRLDGYEIRTAAVMREHPVHHHGAGARRRRCRASRRPGAGDIGVRSLQDWALRCREGASADDRVPVRCSTGVWSRTDAEQRPPAGLPRDPARRRPVLGAASRRLGRARPRCRPHRCARWGSTFPGRAGPGRRASTRTPSASTRWPRSASAIVEVGTVTGEPQPGNPRPRLFRLPADRAVVNRMGFNNDGAEAVAAGWPARRAARPHAGPWCSGVNIGKTKVVPERRGRVPPTTRRARGCSRRTPTTSWSTSSSPNTPGLRNLQAVERLRPLLRAVRRHGRRGRAAGTGPAAGQDRPRPRATRTCWRSPTWPSRSAWTASSPPTPRSPATGSRPRPRRSRRPAPAACPARRCGRAPARCCGCCATGSGPTWRSSSRRRHRPPPADARARLEAGATLLQAYTAFVYEGPAWPRRSSRRLARLRARVAGVTVVRPGPVQVTVRCSP